MTALGREKVTDGLRGTPPLRIPSRGIAQLWIDFDGTISVQDVLDELIRLFAVNDSWRAIEEQWQGGLIGSRRCLSEEFSLLSISPQELLSFLDTIPLDPGFGDLMTLCAAHRVPVTILSDGVEAFIRRILRRHGDWDLAVRANSIEHSGRSISLRCPHAWGGCRSEAAHCKCASVRALGSEERVSIYIGDGRSDLCPARGCEVVFAKGALATALEREGRAFVRFDGLADVRAALAESWGTAPPRECT